MGTSETFEQIVRDHGAMIKRIAAGYESRAPLAEELVQDIHMAIWRALPSFRGASSLRTFVARIATNRAISHVVRASKAPPSVELDEQIPASAGDPETHAIALSRQAKLMSAVQSLPLAYRQAVLLALEGLAPSEIADFLGISANAVAIRMSRAKELLRGMMEDKP